jgi:hypothetical protein
MQNYNKKPRSGRNCGTIRYRPKGLRASDQPMSEREEERYGLYAQAPIQELVDESFMEWEDLRAIEIARESRKHLERCWKLEEQNAALKAETECLRAELEMLRMQTSTQSPVLVEETKYKDAVKITSETIQKRKMSDFFRRVRLFFILLGFLNQIIKYRCKFDNDDVEVEGCGSVLRKIFELVTCISTNISDKILKIPDLDFKFYGSKEQFEKFANKVSEWICENRLNIPGTHFIIGKMRRFTAKKPMPNGSIAEYEKFMIEVIDPATKETFMIDIMNIDGSIVFPCDFTVNSLLVSQTSGIYSKDPLHRKGKFKFIDFILDIISKTTTCMTRSSWKFDDSSLNFLIRGIKMHEAGYEIQGSPILTIDTCPVWCDNSICVSLTGCRCENSNGVSIPLSISIYAAIGISGQKHCPKCRGILKEFVCSTVNPRQSMQEPNELPSKLEYECLVKRTEDMRQGYLVSGLNLLSKESEDALRVLLDFSRKYDNEQESDVSVRAGGAAAPVRRPQYDIDSASDEEDNDLLIRAIGGAAAAQAHAHAQIRARARARAPVQMRAGDAAAAPVRRLLYDSDSDSDSDGGYYRGIIWRGS